MRREIALIAGPRDWNDTRESWLARVPEKVERLTAAKLSYRMIKSAFYGELSDKHWAALEIHRAVEVIEAQREYRKAAERQATLSQRLIVIDQDFHEQAIALAFRNLTKLRGGNQS